MTCSMLESNGQCRALIDIAKGKDVEWKAPTDAQPTIEEPDSLKCIYPTIAKTMPFFTTTHCDVTNPGLFE